MSIYARAKNYIKSNVIGNATRCPGEAQINDLPERKGGGVGGEDTISNLVSKAFFEGVNGVNRLATKGEKILLTTDKTRKKLRTSDKKIN